MKFGKRLSNQIEETLPEWRDKFISYKDLKKRLKLIEPSSASGASPNPSKRPRLALSDSAASDDALDGRVDDASTISAAEEGFMRLLEAELDKFNTFFVEQEEEYIIRQKELQDRLRAAKNSREEMMRVRKEIVDFHGEMVLLENYSALNYTGLVKILKKYDKRTGALIRLPFIRRVLQQPFFTTDVLDQLLKECERMLDGLLPLPPGEEAAAAAALPDAAVEDGCKAGEPSTAGVGEAIPEMEEIKQMESLYMKRTMAALRVLREIRSGSSTVSIFSLPPLPTTAADDRWPTVPVLEGQAAK
ncbi:SPX domain-containing protein 1-like [Wolffia australiana]